MLIGPGSNPPFEAGYAQSLASPGFTVRADADRLSVSQCQFVEKLFFKRAIHSVSKCFAGSLQFYFDFGGQRFDARVIDK